MQGNKGVDGVNGDPGTDGDQGTMGEKGIMGSTGEDGNTGKRLFGFRCTFPTVNIVTPNVTYYTIWKLIFDYHLYKDSDLCDF